jgi:hypothetical protein
VQQVPLVLQVQPVQLAQPALKVSLVYLLLDPQELQDRSAQQVQPVLLVLRV